MPERKIEILAPAGSYAAFSAALRAGADAVYVGGNRFGARAYAENFTDEELIQALRETHLHDKKLYLTVNTLLKDVEIDTLYDYIAPLYENGLDAVIVQDMGVVEYIRSCFPGLDIHASTQMTITGPYGARFAKSQGMTRVVPARELSLEEIRQIRDRTGLEIECFVHGALCYCYSGQCLMSSMKGGRSGNRGQCAQPCRLPYTFDGKKRYYLSPKDICTLELIPDLVEAGIDSFKIEGRMKKPEYVALAAYMYRRYTDLYLQKGREGYRVDLSDREMLMDLYNRGGSSWGYYKKRNGREMLSLDRPNHAGVPAAEVQYQKGREVHALVLTDLNPGDVLDVEGEKSSYTLGKAIKKGGRLIFLTPKSVRLQKGRILNRIRNASLLHRIDEDILSRKLQRSVCAEIYLEADRPAVLRVSSGNIRYEARSAENVQAAQNRPLDSERIRTQILKTGNSEFRIDQLAVHTQGDIFIPVGQLNSLRRAALDGLKEKILSGWKRESAPAPGSCEVRAPKSAFCGTDGKNNGSSVPFLSVYAETKDQLSELVDFIRETHLSVQRIYAGFSILSAPEGGSGTESLTDILQSLSENSGTAIEIYAALPHIFRSTEEHSMRHLLDTIEILDLDGVLVRNCEEFAYLREHGFDKKMILDHNLYVFNRYAKKFWNKLGVREFTAPLELREKELRILGLRDCELEIYGHAPVMISAQCLFRTADRCRRDSRSSGFTDRYGSYYPVSAFCEFCYNVIYNDQPLSLFDEADMIKAASRSLRIRFSVEDREEVREIMKKVL